MVLLPMLHRGIMSSSLGSSGNHSRALPARPGGRISSSPLYHRGWWAILANTVDIVQSAQVRETALLSFQEMLSWLQNHLTRVAQCKIEIYQFGVTIAATRSWPSAALQDPDQRHQHRAITRYVSSLPVSWKSFCTHMLAKPYHFISSEYSWSAAANASSEFTRRFSNWHLLQDGVEPCAPVRDV